MIQNLLRMIKEKKVPFDFLEDFKDSEDSEEKPLTNQFKKAFLENPNIHKDSKTEFIIKYGRPEKDPEKVI